VSSRPRDKRAIRASLSNILFHQLPFSLKRLITRSQAKKAILI
jgi:hypothetical protein